MYRKSDEAYNEYDKKLSEMHEELEQLRYQLSSRVATRTHLTHKGLKLLVCHFLAGKLACVKHANFLRLINKVDMVQNYMKEYNTLQYNTMQCNTIQYNEMLYNTIQYITIQ